MERIVTLESLRKSLDSTTTVAVVSSRLGHNPILHRHICRFLSRSMLDCRARNATLIIATGSAIEPWAVRAAELFGIPIVRIAIEKDDPNADFFVQEVEPSLSRDQVIIELATRVDAVYVRRGGAIDSHLTQRIGDCHDATTRVAITDQKQCAAAGLIDAGAIGWYYAKVESASPNANALGNVDAVLSKVAADNLWTRSDGQWLVHCTRGPSGHWPGETSRQYRDSVLIGDGRSIDRGPIDALVRIVRSGRLIAGAIATSKEVPVVCFSEVPLVELLDRRCFRPQLGRWDYEPFGIAIRRSAAKSIGMEPVIYGEPRLRQTLSVQDRYRFHPIGKTFDWRTEREWRSRQAVDLNALAQDDIRVFAYDSPESRQRLDHCPWQVSFITQNAGLRV